MRLVTDAPSAFERRTDIEKARKVQVAWGFLSSGKMVWEYRVFLGVYMCIGYMSKSLVLLI